ncbi:hypothetical protein KBZ18_01545 [Synechococcus sp. Cruz-9H2]|uniref:hypothetical protein n=1 Tax=unclassified Synechococcus TaxID=2626047 RepID=UPI0020CDEAFA|nr:MULTISPECIES: hypothetical protein [unclassified Synechococcus]MCP9854570.1 hypothetical protein [Synechococcus sp. Cruz-9C9]MCP9861734.1 hypothetical protein [Synechococcus sp. Cruz-7E5]MCP9818174.1 hypothetical protein [Synechococcus sp. Cruz-9H2]MCP9842326.1 hypothetical protein [Synechococcus sp. Edmonson 11F2]MCP9869082.1 hypothetical protein [Synechococcus sp. Cruz-7B9]
MKPPPKPIRSGGGMLGLLGGGGLVLGLSVALVVGLQLGALPWKFRRQMFQLQGAMAGGLVGFVVGWSVGRSRREPGSDDS